MRLSLLTPFLKHSQLTPFPTRPRAAGAAVVSLVALAGSFVGVPGASAAVTVAPNASIADVYAAVAPSVVQVVAGDVEGSGFSVNGGILTNAHVVQDKKDVQIFTSDSRKGNAHVVKIDSKLDLALLQPDISLPPLDLETPQQQRVGDELLILGYPLGLRQNGGAPILERGVLSAVLSVRGRTLIQTDAAENHGNSGGPMLNMRGKVIGVVALGLRDDDAQGVNFAIGSDTVQQFLSNPSQPPPPAASNTYQGDPRAIAISTDDLPDDWVQVNADSSRLSAGQYTATFELNADDQADEMLEVIVVVEATAKDADSDFQQVTARPSRGARRLQVPQIGDATYAEVSNRGLALAARSNNVIVMVLESGGSDPDSDLLVSVANVMVGRANPNVA
jgi:S1-C subfamily serine protease